MGTEAIQIDKAWKQVENSERNDQNRRAIFITPSPLLTGYGKIFRW